MPSPTVPSSSIRLAITPAAAAHRPATTPGARLLRASATTAAAVLLLTATACSSSSSSSSDFPAWWANGGKQRFETLRADTRAQAGAADLTAMNAACTAVPGHVQDARKYGPIPDKTAQEYWSRYLDAYEAAAKACIDGTKNRDTTKVDQVTDELTLAQHEVELLQARIGELGTKV